MGRLKKLSTLLCMVVLFSGCDNALQEYLNTNLFGPAYHLQVDKLSKDEAVNFGTKIDMAGDYLIVSAPGEYNNSANPEAVYIYHRTGVDTWDEGYKITPPDGVPGDNFGYDAAVSEDYAVIGAPYHTVDNPSAGGDQEAAGAAYIYERAGTNTWELAVKLTQQDSWATDTVGIEALDYALFGTAVEIKENQVFISARQDDGIGPVDSKYGSVYVFKNEGTWVYDDMLTAGPDVQTGAQFGWDIDAGGDYIAVGAPSENIGAINKAGAVYLFQYLVDGWENDVRITASDREVQDGFGLKVSINNDYLAVASPQKTVEGSDFAGKVYIYSKESSGEWSSSPVELLPETSHENDFFGFPVTLHGNFLMIGCLFRDDMATDAGAVYLYTNDDGSGWTLDTTLYADDAAAGTYFGRSMAITDDYAAVGATHTFEYDAGGAVYLFR